LIVISLIRVKMVCSLRRLNKDDGIKDRGQLGNAMPVCPCYDQGQRGAKADIFEYIEVFYNRSRRHSALGFLIPQGYAMITLAA
jgi:hypothetical protein